MDVTRSSVFEGRAIVRAGISHNQIRPVTLCLSSVEVCWIRVSVERRASSSALLVLKGEHLRPQQTQDVDREDHTFEGQLHVAMPELSAWTEQVRVEGRVVCLFVVICPRTADSPLSLSFPLLCAQVLAR